MKYCSRFVWTFVLGSLALSQCEAESAPRHYAFFGFDRGQIHKDYFLESPGFEGAQLRYSWNALEPNRGEYDFSAIENDLQTLKKAGKRLFVQVQDVSFSPQVKFVPQYLLDDPEFNGGANLQYAVNEDDESKSKPEGWVARRWDPAVQERFHKLIHALGDRFDGEIEGLNLSETAVGFGETGVLYPEGFSPDRYRDAIIKTMSELKAAFPNTTVIVYANFMPGDWNKWDECDSLRAVYAAAQRMGVGVGGPDIKVNKRWQMFNSYPLIREASGHVPAGVAVQWGNYEVANPETGKQVTIEDIYAFARGYLKLDYIFWEPQPPFFKKAVIPFVEAR